MIGDRVKYSCLYSKCLKKHSFVHDLYVASITQNDV